MDQKWLEFEARLEQMGFHARKSDGYHVFTKGMSVHGHIEIVIVDINAQTELDAYYRCDLFVNGGPAPKSYILSQDIKSPSDELISDIMKMANEFDQYIGKFVDELDEMWVKYKRRV